MPLTLPFLAYALIFWIVRRKESDWRYAALQAATWWGVFVVLCTESLGFGRWITRGTLSASWLCFCGLLLAYGLLRTGREPKQVDPLPQNHDDKLSSSEWWLLGGVGLIVLLVGITAILSPPNTWDAVSYHMSRVTLWMTNRDVSFYPTYYSPQLFLSPWAEYAILHFDLLYGGDRVAGLVEWLCFAGNIVGVSVIAKSLGASKRGQILSAVAFAAIPEAILESSGAMNTCAGAFWVVVSTCFLLRWRRDQRWSVLLGAAAATGLAVFTKGTAYVFLPCVVLACWLMSSPYGRRRFTYRLPVFILVILVLNGPLTVRNYKISGSPLGFPAPQGDDMLRQYANSHLSLSITAANTVKNLALHVGTPSDALNSRMERSIASIFRFLHIDPNDPNSTYRGGFHLNRTSSHESNAGNPLQLALFLLSVGLLILDGRKMDRAVALYAAGTIAAFVLFCAAFRWQMWNSRYHLPVFALGCAVIGTVLSRHWKPAATNIIGGALILAALPFACNNSLRPLNPWRSDSVVFRPRAEVYFTDFHESAAASYIATAREINSNQCEDVGVDGSLQDFDYPLFAFLDVEGGKKKIRYVGVTNLTSAYQRPGEPDACLVVCLGCADALEKWDKYRNIGGRASVDGDNVIFSSTGSQANVARTDNARLDKDDVGQLEQRMTEEVEAIHSIDLAPVASAVAQASSRWPEKKADLNARLEALYVKRVFSWRIQHSADPMRRRGEPLDGLGIDHDQAVAAEQTLRAWLHGLPHEVDELRSSTEELSQSPQEGCTALQTTTVADHREVATTCNNPDLATRVTNPH